MVTGAQTLNASATDAKRVCILGAGSWGSALAIHCGRLGHQTRLWGRDAALMDEIARTRSNPRYPLGQPFPETVEPGTSLSWALEGADVVLVVVPSHAFRDLAGQLQAHLSRATLRKLPFIAASKGIEAGSLATPVEILRSSLPELARVAALGGPSFAAEVASGLPTAVVLATENPADAEELQLLLSGDSLRVYSSDDLIGVELGGALKNVIALAAGVCDGAGLGHNARAAVMTRGLAETQRLATRLGARTETLWGLAGVGDLILTCTGGLSRNRRVGLALGAGRMLDEILAEVGMVAEGVRTTQSAFELARREGVDMPIVETMHGILYEGLQVGQAVRNLMDRALRAEA